MQKFKIDIWFEGIQNAIKLGTISIYADTEQEALHLAKSHTTYDVSGVDDTAWQVREQILFNYGQI